MPTWRASTGPHLSGGRSSDSVVSYPTPLQCPALASSLATATATISISVSTPSPPFPLPLKSERGTWLHAWRAARVTWQVGVA
ncbi:hypothetical protein NL676_000758 [Syzygium grande]|nr:hypothetical protein NL676_000758 [Syzygium grande]